VNIVTFILLTTTSIHPTITIATIWKKKRKKRKNNRERGEELTNNRRRRTISEHVLNKKKSIRSTQTIWEKMC